MKRESVDIAIVGAGPAGIAACLEAVRLGLSPLLVSEGPVGGLVHAARRLDNLPGYPGGISGSEWARACEIQLEKAGIPRLMSKVLAVAGTDLDFLITTSREIVSAHAVVLAVGTRPRPFPVALPHGPFIRRDAAGLPSRLEGLRAAVVGSGEAAVDTALNLADRGAAVTLLSRAEAPRACAALLGELSTSEVRVLAGTAVCRAAEDAGTVRLLQEDGGEWTGNLAVFCIGRESRIDEIRLDCPPGTREILTAGDMNRTTDRYVLPAMADGRAAAFSSFISITREA